MVLKSYTCEKWLPLSTLLSMELSVDEKIGVMEKEYRIAVDDRIREEVSDMCNLSQGIRERGRAEGRAQGRAESETEFILNMYENHFTLEQIAVATKKSVEEVSAVIKKKEPASA